MRVSPHREQELNPVAGFSNAELRAAYRVLAALRIVRPGYTDIAHHASRASVPIVRTMMKRHIGDLRGLRETRRFACDVAALKEEAEGGSVLSSG